MKRCPQCGKEKPHTMMMVECDECLMENIRATEAKGEPYINKNGLWIKNQDYKE